MIDTLRLDVGVDVTCAVNALVAGDTIAIDELVDDDDDESTLDDERDVCIRKSSANIVKGDR